MIAYNQYTFYFKRLGKKKVFSSIVYAQTIEDAHDFFYENNKRDKVTILEVGEVFARPFAE